MPGSYWTKYRACGNIPLFQMRPAFYLLALLSPLLHAADPAGAFQPWSGVKRYDLEKLNRGGIVTECNGSMNFARGISAQAVFLLDASPETALRVLLTADPTKQPELETYQRPLFNTEQEARFETVKLDAKIPAVRRLLETMRKRDDLHLSHEEIALLPHGDSIEDAQRFWAETMRQRWSRWMREGDLSVTAAFDVRREIASLLKEEPKIAQHFATLLTPFTKAGAPAPAAIQYWDISNVNGSAALCLGTIYTHAGDGRQQVLDVSYYASSGYLASITLYEMLPVVVEGKRGTLAWEGCLVSAPALAGGFGVKKAIGSRLMLGDLEKSIRGFQHDAAAAK